MLKITGLDKLQRQIADAQRAFESIDGTITTLNFDPSDPRGVEDAIRQMEAAVDSKSTPYRSNDLVAKVAKALKERYREEIYKRTRGPRT